MIKLRPMDGVHCTRCGEEYSDSNVYTAAGWRETNITGFCEKCWDEIFADDDEVANDRKM